ncbi:hypothetical protein Trydic_g8012 [Trypoxylus dichotomus]
MIVQKIYERDHDPRKLFGERMLDVLATGDVLFMMSDEAHFHLETIAIGQQTTQKNYIGNHCIKVTVRCGLSKEGIAGPYFFEEGIGRIQ